MVRTAARHSLYSKAKAKRILSDSNELWCRSRIKSKEKYSSSRHAYKACDDVGFLEYEAYVCGGIRGFT